MIGPALRELVMLAALSMALGLVSRVWFARWLLTGLLAPTGRYFSQFYQVLRTPGNIVHEGGHAVGYLLTGYRILEIRFCFNDPQRRGYVRAGAPFAPWGTPLLARLIASPAPLLAGALTLQLCARWLEVPVSVAGAFHPGPAWWPELHRLSSAWHGLAVWFATTFGPWQLFTFIALTISLGIELAPSWEDLQALAWPAILLAASLFVIEAAARAWPPVAPLLNWIDAHVALGLHWLVGPLWWTLILLIGLGIVLSPLRLLVAGWRV